MDGATGMLLDMTGSHSIYIPGVPRFNLFLSIFGDGWRRRLQHHKVHAGFDSVVEGTGGLSHPIMLGTLKVDI